MPSQPSTPEDKIGILIVEDQTAIRQMLVTFVAAMPGFSVVGEAGNIQEAIRISSAQSPQVVVLDWMLLDGVGLEFLRAVKWHHQPPNVLVFSANTTELAVREALAGGARGYIEKTASFAEFTAALQAVATGRTYLGPVVSRVVQRLVSRPNQAGTMPDLTLRERDVLRFLAEGQSSKEIAGRLGLSVRTVENHRANLARKTGLRSIAQLALHAIRLGLIEAPAAAAAAGST